MFYALCDQAPRAFHSLSRLRFGRAEDHRLHHRFFNELHLAAHGQPAPAGAGLPADRSPQLGAEVGGVPLKKGEGLNRAARAGLGC